MQASNSYGNLPAEGMALTSFLITSPCTTREGGKPLPSPTTRPSLDRVWYLGQVFLLGKVQKQSPLLEEVLWDCGHLPLPWNTVSLEALPQLIVWADGKCPHSIPIQPEIGRASCRERG